MHPFAVPLSLHNFCILTRSYNHHVLAGEFGAAFAKVRSWDHMLSEWAHPSGLNPNSMFSPSELPQVFLSVCPTGLDNA